MTTSRLEQAIQRYEIAINQLIAAIAEPTHSNQSVDAQAVDSATTSSKISSTKQLTPAQILEVLTARDGVQAALTDTTQTSGESLAAIAELDKRLKGLKENTEAIALLCQNNDWQASFKPAKESWWWFWDTPKPMKWWDRFDWVWSAVSVTCLTISLGLVGDISSRFLTGGSDTLGALAVSTQSILTLLTAGGALTLAGQEGYKRILNSLKIPEQRWHVISAGASLLLVFGLLGFRLSLPLFATKYSNWGYSDYEKGDWGSAEEKYQRALQLNPDDAEAHFNLGLLYENLQNFDAARTQYQFAMQGGILPAVNNLARLHILKNNYSAAVTLLLKTLDSEREKKLDDETKYAVLKNLGWVRLKQGDYSSAEAQLLDAIDLQKSAKLEKNKAAPHCLLAQLIEAQGDKEGALLEWEICNKEANSFNPDDDGWRITAQKCLAAKETQKCLVEVENQPTKH